MMDIALKYNDIKSSIGLSETDFWTEIPLEVKQTIHGGGVQFNYVTGEITYER